MWKGIGEPLDGSAITQSWGSDVSDGPHSPEYVRAGYKKRDVQMGYLIEPWLVPTPIGTVLRTLQDAHDLIADEARSSVRRLRQHQIDDWGSRAKRESVDLLNAMQKCPQIGKSEERLAEIVTQLSTVERLLDALGWASGNGFVTVEQCHPTQSHGSCDLEVTRPGRRASFEVCDIVKCSNNGKVRGDIKRLLELCPSSGHDCYLVLPDTCCRLNTRRALGTLSGPQHHGASCIYGVS